jgi:hypothetical protein
MRTGEFTSYPETGLIGSGQRISTPVSTPGIGILEELKIMKKKLGVSNTGLLKICYYNSINTAKLHEVALRSAEAIITLPRVCGQCKSKEAVTKWIHFDFVLIPSQSDHFRCRHN